MPGHSPADIQDRQSGGKRINRSRWWAQTGGDVFMKPAKNIGVNENNVALPATASITSAAGAPGILTLHAQRECLVRDLVLEANDAAITVGAARERNIVVTGLTVAGENCLAGAGELPASMFFNDTQARPEFDMPVAGGVDVIINTINRSLSAAGTDISAGCRID